MSRYKTAMRLNGELVYVNGVFLGCTKELIDNLDNYARFLEGKSPQNVNFEIGNVSGVSFEFDDPERINMVLFTSSGLGNYIPTSAHALSDEVSLQMLKEFSDVTGFRETDVHDVIVDFYKSIEEARVRLPVDNPNVVI